MIAEVLHEFKPIEEKPLVDEMVPEPKLGPDDVLIRIKACGVCHSNLHEIEGDWIDIYGVPSKLPIILGHEISGIIEKIGGNVDAWQKDQHVGIQPLYDTCRRCEYCMTGREHLCPNQNVTGETVDGGFAEFIVAPSDFIYPIPENLSFEEAAPLFCPGVTGYHAVKQAEVRFGQKVAVMGIGGVGHMSLQFAKLAGGEVTAVDVSREKLNLALELGADDAVLASDFDKLPKFDVVMVHTPSKQAIDQALKSVKSGGTLLMAVSGNINVDFAKEYMIKTSVIGPRIDMLNVLNLASKGKVRVKWRSFKLEEANDVLLKLKKGEIVGRAVLTP